LPFEVSPLVNGSNAELLLLLPEHRGKIMPDWSEYLGGVGVGDASGGGGSGDAADAFGDGVRDIRLYKKKTEVAQTTGVCCYR
jgi:hypothetical protein